MALALDGGAFVVSAGVSLAASSTLVSRIERIGFRLDLSETLLGLFAALAADGPEIVSAVTALAHGQHDIGVGVVLGSNVFNLAALLGLAAIVAGRLAFHRRAVVLEGAVAVSVALVAILTVTGVVVPVAGVLLAVVVLGPYVALSAMRARRIARLPLPRRALAWIATALREEGSDLAPAMEIRRARAIDVFVAAGSLVVVIAAAMVMERTGSVLGSRAGFSSIVTGAVFLAAVTSLPNAVAAIHLARRGRGAAVLSEAMNSNSLNVLCGFLLPSVVVGIGARSGDAVLVAAWYGGLSLLVLGMAWRYRGLRLWHGAVVVAGYVGFVVALAL